MACFCFAFPKRFVGCGLLAEAPSPGSLVSQGAGDAPGQDEGCPQPSLAGEPRSYVGAELGAGDVPPPAGKIPVTADSG